MQLPDMVLKSAVNKYQVTGWTSIVDGPHVLGLHVSLHLRLLFTSLATDEAYKAQLPLSHIELHQRIHIVIRGHI